LDIKSILNGPQLEAAMHNKGPMLILAGAGSGKTRVITYRIAYLISECGVKPENILAVTFTNKAAQEMKTRIKKAVGASAEKIVISTFHSLGVRILRQYADRLGYTKGFTIYDQDDRERLLKECMHDAKVSEKEIKAYDMLRIIQDLKNRLVTPAEYRKDKGKDYESLMVARTFEIYEDRLKKSDCMDFDDLISKPIDILQGHPDVLEALRERFKYIMIDEYQDINRSQYIMITALAEKHKNICAVGDDDQSIYRFRGADITNILNFEEDYPGAKVIRLEQNYRSTKNILAAAHSVIRNNQGRKEKAIWTDNDEGEKIIFHNTDDEVAESETVLNEIDKLLRAGVDLKNIAVFYRTNAQSRAIEDRFRRAGVPYKLVGGISFYSRMEIKDMLSYLRLIANPKDVISFRRIINVPPRGLGDTTIDKVEQFAFDNNLNLLEALGRSAEIPGIKPASRDTGVAFFMLMDSLNKRMNEMTLKDLLKDVLSGTGYLEYWQNDQTLKSRDRVENIKELVSAIAEFEERGEGKGLTDFLGQVALMTDGDKLDENKEAVTLMTMHAAKGLEFDNVFITGMNEKVFPHKMCLEEEGGIEEERRLCYVGITRARKKLHLLSAMSRRQFGTTETGKISRFIDEIPENLIVKKGRPVMRQLEEKLSGKAGDEQRYMEEHHPEDFSQENETQPEVKQGDRVAHKIMGKGTIMKIEPYGDDYRVTVMFEKHGKKVLSARYAGLVKA